MLESCQEKHREKYPKEKNIDSVAVDCARLRVSVDLFFFCRSWRSRMSCECVQKLRMIIRHDIVLVACLSPNICAQVGTEFFQAAEKWIEYIKRHGEL